MIRRPMRLTWRYVTCAGNLESMTNTALADPLMDALAARGARYPGADAFAVANEVGLVPATNGRSRSDTAFGVPRPRAC